VTAELEGGDRGKAMKRLRVPPLGETQNPLTTFRVGLFLGIAIVLILIAVVAGESFSLISSLHCVNLFVSGV